MPGIPDKFYSFDSGAPFKECIICGMDLMQNGFPYVIEKAIKKYTAFNTSDIIFEYAMCFSCMEDMRKSMSSDSKNKIEAYFQNEMSRPPIQYELNEQNEFDLDECLSKCIIKGTEEPDLSEYQIYAHCAGDKLLLPYQPFMLSGEAIEELQELISEETRGEMDDFIDEYFGLPPEYKDVIKPSDLILI